MRKTMYGGLVLVVLIVMCSICQAAQLSDGQTWKEYTTENYTCLISKTGWVNLKLGEKKWSIFSPYLMSSPLTAGNQWQTDKIEKIEGTEEDIEGGKLYTIKATFTTGASFRQKVTCTKDTVKIEYKVRAIPGEHEFSIHPMRGFKSGDKLWDCILSKTSLKYKLRESQPGDLKDIMKMSQARPFHINRSKPSVEWFEIGNYYGRKVKVAILSNGKTNFYYKKGGPNSDFSLSLAAGTSEESLSGASGSYVFQKPAQARRV